MFKRILDLIRSVAAGLFFLFYFAIGFINIIVLIHAIALQFDVGLFFAIFISILIGYIPVFGSALTVWGGCIWLGLNVLQSIGIFMVLPFVIAIILGSLLKDD